MGLAINAFPSYSLRRSSQHCLSSHLNLSWRPSSPLFPSCRLCLPSWLPSFHLEPKQRALFQNSEPGSPPSTIDCSLLNPPHWYAYKPSIVLLTQFQSIN